MSILRLFPVLCKQEVVKFQPFCYGCSTILQNRFGSSKAVKKLPPSRNKKSTSKAAKNATAGGGDRLRIAYHNDHVTQQAVKRDEFVHDLKFETPPLLFIKKYKAIIDTNDIDFGDNSTKKSKRSGATRPLSLSQRKIDYIQETVRESENIERLREALRKRPARPVMNPRVEVGVEKRSVFTDSDFELIRCEIADQRLQTKTDLDVEWTEAKLELKSLGKHYLILSKARLTMLVCMTATAGYGMAPGPLSLQTAVYATIGTALASSAANSINQILEVPFDSQMNRTKNRVLVRGCMSTFHAFSFALVTASVGTILLYTQVNGLSAFLSAFNLFLYTCVYTPLKRVSIINTWVGSLVGAIPPLIGWSAATGSLEPSAFILAGILFAWQFPHFNSLSWNLRPDYSKAGYRMMSVTNPDLCRRVALRYSAACIAICTAAPLLDLTTWAFALDSFVLNAYLTYLAYRFYEKADSNSSRKLFRYTLVHLPLLMTLMFISKKQLTTDNNDN